MAHARQIQTVRQIDRQTDRQTGRQADTQTHNSSGRQKGKHASLRLFCFTPAVPPVRLSVREPGIHPPIAQLLSAQPSDSTDFRLLPRSIQSNFRSRDYGQSACVSVSVCVCVSVAEREKKKVLWSHGFLGRLWRIVLYCKQQKCRDFGFYSAGVQEVICAMLFLFIITTVLSFSHGKKTLPISILSRPSQLIRLICISHCEILTFYISKHSGSYLHFAQNIYKATCHRWISISFQRKLYSD